MSTKQIGVSPVLIPGNKPCNGGIDYTNVSSLHENNRWIEVEGPEYWDLIIAVEQSWKDEIPEKYQY